MTYAIFVASGLLVALFLPGCSSKKFKRDLFVLNKTKVEFSDVLVIDNGAPITLKRWYDSSAHKYGESWNGQCCSEQLSHFTISAMTPDGTRVDLGACEVKISVNHGVNIVIERNPDYRLNCTTDLY